MALSPRGRERRRSRRSRQVWSLRITSMGMSSSSLPDATSRWTFSQAYCKATWREFGPRTRGVADSCSLGASVPEVPPDIHLPEDLDHLLSEVQRAVPSGSPIKGVIPIPVEQLATSGRAVRGRFPVANSALCDRVRIGRYLKLIPRDGHGI